MATRLPLGTYVGTLPILLELDIYWWKLAASHWRWSKEVAPSLAQVLDPLYLFGVGTMDWMQPSYQRPFLCAQSFAPRAKASSSS